MRSKADNLWDKDFQTVGYVDIIWDRHMSIPSLRSRSQVVAWISERENTWKLVTRIEALKKRSQWRKGTYISQVRIQVY
jgi:hypothetical protein